MPGPITPHLTPSTSKVTAFTCRLQGSFMGGQGHRRPRIFILKVTPGQQVTLEGLFLNHFLLLLSLVISRMPQPWSWEIVPLGTFLLAVEHILLFL